MKTSTIPMMITPNSKRIASYGFDPVRQVLAVRFKRYTGEPGPAVYEYPGVTAEQFAELEKAESKGSHIGRIFVASQYAFEKMAPVEVADSEGGEP